MNETLHLCLYINGVFKTAPYTDIFTIKGNIYDTLSRLYPNFGGKFEYTATGYFSSLKRLGCLKEGNFCISRETDLTLMGITVEKVSL